MKHWFTLIGLTLSAMLCGAENILQTPVPVPETLIRESLASLERAGEFLEKKQTADGEWGGDPAITALCAMALLESGDAIPAAKKNKMIAKARQHILKFVQKDGSIYPADRRRAYPVYSTAIILTFLADLRNKEDETIMRNARKYLIGLQIDEDNKDVPVDKDDPRYGGFGYGPGKQGASHVDLSNSQWVAEALYASEYLVKESNGGTAEEAKEADLAWDKLAVFITKMQHLPDTNDSKWVVSDPNDPSYGGFIYAQPKTGKEMRGGPGGPGGKGRGGKGGPASYGRNGSDIGPGQKGNPVDVRTGQGESLRSYGSMTYAGLKSMIYAKVKKDDPRVVAALSWAAKHYTLDENPGRGTSGHYYYLQTFAKAHSALGADSVKTPDGVIHNWRLDVIRKLITVQKGDGSWVNTDGRYQESMPELVTAYSMLTMELALGKERFAGK